MIKDITRLGRDITKTLIVDNVPANFRNCPENGIHISSWEGSKKDRNLLSLLPKLLSNFVVTKTSFKKEFQMSGNIFFLRKMTSHRLPIRLMKLKIEKCFSKILYYDFFIRGLFLKTIKKFHNK